MKLSDCLLYWRESKPSWNMSRNSRVVSLRCLVPNHLHPSWINSIRRHFIFSNAQGTPDMVLALNTYLDYLKIFWHGKGPFLRMNWLSKPHGAHIIPAMCVLPVARWGGSNINTLKPQVKIREDNTLFPQQRRTNVNTVNPAVYPPRYEMRMAVQEFHNKGECGYSAMANLIFQLWQKKNIRVHVEDQNLMEREAIQLVKDFTAECALNEVESTWGWSQRTNKLLKASCKHLKNAFQSGESNSELISDFYGWAQKRNESEDVFVDDLQILVWKLIAWKPEFGVDANKQRKHQYTHKMQDLYYVAIACSVLQMSDSMESFMQFQGCLAMPFGGRSKLEKTNSQISSVEVSSSVISEEVWKLSKNSWQRQSQIDQQVAHISSLEGSKSEAEPTS